MGDSDVSMTKPMVLFEVGGRVPPQHGVRQVGLTNVVSRSPVKVSVLRMNGIGLGPAIVLVGRYASPRGQGN